MAEKNEIMNIMDYEVVDTRSNDIQISGTEIATQLVAVIPNAVAAPFQRYHEVEVALYMGAKITKENESVLYEVCKNKGIKCFKMLQDFHGKEFIVRAEPYEKIIDVVNSNFHDK